MRELINQGVKKMATTPGIFSEFPWERLGNFKYVTIAPMVIHSTYSFFTKDKTDIVYLIIFPFMLWRMLHNQLWSTLARYRTAKGDNLIIDKSIEFEQVDRERTWDDQVVLNTLIFYGAYWVMMDTAKNIPFWRTDGLFLIFLIHSGPVEFMYYWLHRALHHHYLYSRYHSHHHSSIVTEPITAVIHPFAEVLAYSILFAIPGVVATIVGINSIGALGIYMTYVDFMNSMGHCNFEFVPNWLFTVFPPLKYLMYTPSFHSLHHTKFRTNYSLFMPFYDYIYNTMDKSTDALYHETSRKNQEDIPDVVHLTHLTTPQSIYQLRLGIPSLASEPLASTWYLWLMWPVTLWSMVVAWLYSKSFVVERNTFGKLKLQSWVVPRYNINYVSKWEREAINKLIEAAIVDADAKGVKVVSLGLLNQGGEMNRNGKVYLEKNPKLKVKIVDGSGLAVAVVLSSIPKGTSQVMFSGRLTKIAFSLVSTLCSKGVKVGVLRKDEYEELKKKLPSEGGNNLLFHQKNNSPQYKVWLVGEDLSEKEQLVAQKGSLFIPISQFPPKKARKDCFYLNTPSMAVPKSFANLHSCENWLPRRVMSAWRIAGIVHGLEEWQTNETGDQLSDIDKVWEASLHHGFRLVPPT